jgi:hypothetical protein
MSPPSTIRPFASGWLQARLTLAHAHDGAAQLPPDGRACLCAHLCRWCACGPAGGRPPGGPGRRRAGAGPGGAAGGAGRGSSARGTAAGRRARGGRARAGGAGCAGASAALVVHCCATGCGWSSLVRCSGGRAWPCLRLLTAMCVRAPPQVCGAALWPPARAARTQGWLTARRASVAAARLPRGVLPCWPSG